MKAPSALALVLTLALGAVLSAAQGPTDLQVPVQPLLGVGNNPTTPPPPSGSPDAFFDDNVLHRIDLVMNAKDWQTLKDNFLDNTYYPTDFKWNGDVLRNVGIRSRGTGSRSGVKPGLRVDFDRYTSNQKFLGLKSFVLRNNTQDASNLHERLSMLMFRRLNLPAPREAHVRLYVNDAYAGLFTIVESVDKDFLKRNFGEDTGYLYDYDYPVTAAPFYFEDKGSDPALYVPQPFKPETHETDPRPEFIVQWVQTVNSANSTTFQNAVGEYINLQKFLRHVAVETFVGDYDGFIGNFGINNFYLYRFDNQKLFNLIAWDKSEAFAAGPESSVFHNINDVPDPQRNRLMMKALSFTDLYNTYLDALLECARTAAELVEGDARGWMEREIEKEYQQIKQAAYDDAQKPYTNEAFEQSINALRDFARRRSDLVTSEVNRSRP